MLRILSLLLISACLWQCMGSEAESDNSRSLFRPASPPPFNELQLVQADRMVVPGERVGGIRPGMSMAQVENLYGSENLKSRELDPARGDTLPGYLLFPGTKDEVEITLGIDRQPAYVTIRNPRSPWTSAAGITVGTTLRELNEGNETPFLLSGFGWEGGGTVRDWLGGKLEGLDLRLTYAPEQLPAEGLDGQLQGNRELRSDAPPLQHLGVRVRELRVDIHRVEEE